MPTTSRLNSRKLKPSTQVWLLKPMPQPPPPQKWWRKPSQRAQDPHKHLLLPRRKMKLMPRKRHLRHPGSLRSLPSPPSTVLLRRPSYQISTIVHCDFDASHTYKPCQIKQFIALEEKVDGNLLSLPLFKAFSKLIDELNAILCTNWVAITPTS